MKFELFKVAAQQPGVTTSANFARDGRALAIYVTGKAPKVHVMPDGNRYSVPFDEKTRRVVFRPAVTVAGGAVPDMAAVVPARHRLEMWRPGSDELQYLQMTSICQAAYSANGMRLAVANIHGEVQVFDLDSGKPVKVAGFELSRKSMVTGLSFNSNGLLLYVLTAGGQCHLLEVQREEVVGEMTSGNESWDKDFHPYAVAAHGEILGLAAYAGTASKIYCMSHSSRYTFACDVGIGNEIHSLTFNDADTLVAAGPGGVAAINVRGSSAGVFRKWVSEKPSDRVLGAGLLGDTINVLFAHGHVPAVYEDRTASKK